MRDVPAYQQIAETLRQRIAAGELPEGAKMPTEDQLIAEFGRSRTVVRYALNALRGDGLIHGRQGSGNYVSPSQPLLRRAPGRDQRSRPDSTSPFARDAAAAGIEGSWEHHSEHAEADAQLAQRLAIAPGAPVMKTSYRFLAGGTPIQLSTSWEPLEITGGTPVEWPEEGAAVGVVARMDLIGRHVDDCLERVTSRVARPDEVNALRLPLRGPQVLVVDRTYFAAGQPVEVADIILSSRYELVYRYPIDD